MSSIVKCLTVFSVFLLPELQAARNRRHGDAESSRGEAVGPKDNRRILCPVLAAMFRAGDLNADSEGNVEIADVQNGLNGGIGVTIEGATFQGFGISNFDASQKVSQQIRNRCLPNSIAGVRCLAGRRNDPIEESSKRFFNLFTMNGKQVMEHGMSTGVRGGANNMPEDFDNCGGYFPCESLFQQFWVRHADSRGRFYLENIKKIICFSRQFGDRSGENSWGQGTMILPTFWEVAPVPTREWQMKGAMTSLLYGFGNYDEDGKIFLTMKAVRQMMMEGRYPDDYKKRDGWGCLLSGCDNPSIDRFRMDIGTCPASETDGWWRGTACPSDTGATCTNIFKRCQNGSICIGGRCMCPRDETGRSMCAKNGACVKQNRPPCTYFGKPCNNVIATNPEAPGNENML